MRKVTRFDAPVGADRFSMTIGPHDRIVAALSIRNVLRVFVETEDDGHLNPTDEPRMIDVFALGTGQLIPSRMTFVATTFSGDGTERHVYWRET